MITEDRQRSAGWPPALLALAACERKPAVDTAAIEDEIRRGGREMAAAYNSGDIDTVVAKFAPDAVFMPPAVGSDERRRGGPQALDRGQRSDTRGRARCRARRRRFRRTPRPTSAGFPAGITYRNASGQDEPGGYYVQVWENREGKWLIARMIWTEDHPPPAPPLRGGTRRSARDLSLKGTVTLKGGCPP